MEGVCPHGGHKPVRSKGVPGQNFSAKLCTHRGDTQLLLRGDSMPRDEEACASQCKHLRETSEYARITLPVDTLQVYGLGAVNERYGERQELASTKNKEQK